MTSRASETPIKTLTLYGEPSGPPPAAAGGRPASRYAAGRAAHRNDALPTTFVVRADGHRGEDRQCFDRGHLA